MSSLLVRENDTIKEKVYYGELEGKIFSALEKEDLEKLKIEEIQEVNLEFLKPNFKLETLYLSDAAKLSSSDSLKIDLSVLRFCRFKRLLKKWDLKDNGIEIELNEDNIGSLDNSISTTMLDALEKNI
jgi:hypothetical protein